MTTARNMTRFAFALASTLFIGAILASSSHAAFGVAGFDGQTTASGAGDPYTQAGGHPYAISTTVALNSHLVGEVLKPDLPVKDILVHLPAGVMGNATTIPRCKAYQVAGVEVKCPVSSIVGRLLLDFGAGFHGSLPLYNMVPPTGVPARFAFNFATVITNLDAAVRGQGADLHLELGSRNTPSSVSVFDVRPVFWGIPADPKHDAERCRSLWPDFPGFDCSLFGEPGEPSGPNSYSGEPVPLLTMPTRCTPAGVGLPYRLRTNPWVEPTVFQEAVFDTHEPPGFPLEPALWGPEVGTTGCDRVQSDPNIVLQSTADKASSPTGLEVELSVPDTGLLNPDGTGQSHLKKVEVTLPEGITINPSAAEGLGVCTPAQFDAETASSLPGEGCPDSSRLGQARLDTPVLDEPLSGGLFLAHPDDPATDAPGAENPFDSLIALYIVAKNPQSGVIIKLPGNVQLDPTSGQIVTTFDQLPQAPFSHFNLKFREGARAALATPQACGTYTTTARFTPWSNPQVITDTSTFRINAGVGNGPCPSGGLPPFKPGLIAGSVNNLAGSYSPFNVRLFRADEEQEITHFSIKLPPGVAGKLAGIPFCSDAAIDAAKSKSGASELSAPSCPAASEVGRTLVGAGVGSVQTYAPGKIYLAGPYHGSALSIAAVTAAKVGPFDLGTVVVRQALKIDPETAEVFIDATGSDPIPHLIDGVTVHLRDIRVYVDRPEFTYNPTSCAPTSTASTVLGSGLDFSNAIDDEPVTVSTRFQAADCAALGFKPRLGLRLLGGTKRGQNPKFKATLRMKPGQANIARAQVTLPRSAFLDQAHIRTVCTRVQYAADQCPARSVYGYARAITPLLDEPLQGPVYLRSGEHKLPDLVAGLKNGKIELDLVGRIDSFGNGRIRNTFESVPDAPVSLFTLTMQGGKKGLIVNSTNICRGKHRAIVEFDGHNGKIRDSKPALRAQCGKKRKAKRAHKRADG